MSGCRVAIRAGLLLLLALVACSAMAGMVRVTVVDADGAPVADAVASLHPLGHPPATPAAPAMAYMDQKGLSFVPQVLPVRAGTRVTFPNSDHVRHSVYSFSATKPFELLLYAGRHPAPLTFDTPGVVVLGCNIHDWMLGYIYVLDTPYFAKSGTVGKIVLTDVPAGRYELRLWHPRLPAGKALPSETVVVPAQGDLERAYRLTLEPPEQSNEPPPALRTSTSKPGSAQ